MIKEGVKLLNTVQKRLGVKSTESDYCLFAAHINRLPESDDPEKRRVLELVREMHPYKLHFQRISALETLRDKVKDEPKTRKLIIKPLLKLLDERSVLDETEGSVVIQAVGVLGIQEALPRLEERYNSTSERSLKRDIVWSVLHFADGDCPEEAKNIIQMGMNDGLYREKLGEYIDNPWRGWSRDG